MNGTSAGLGEEEGKLKCSCQGKSMVSEVLCLHNLIFWVQVGKGSLPAPENWCVCTAHVLLVSEVLWVLTCKSLCLRGSTELSTFGYLHGAGGTVKITWNHPWAQRPKKQSVVITTMQEHKVKTKQMDKDLRFQTHEEISYKAWALCLCYVSLQILTLFRITFCILGIN